MTSYEEIYELALSNITDPSLRKWAEEDLIQEVHSWMVKAIYSLPNLKEELSNTDDENETFTVDLSNTAKRALSLEMDRQWLEPQILSVSNTLMRSSKKESYSQEAFLKQLIGLDDSLNVKIKKLIRDDDLVSSSYFE